MLPFARDTRMFVCGLCAGRFEFMAFSIVYNKFAKHPGGSVAGPMRKPKP
jgi:hypothetical protein